ncbi:hypothetical protein KOW79_010078 [Hemibagrus wyckioides]|uniref:Uncharacterized protein n=1 Tax=Hemibagrus wyckioides TaxID=337641 RepID=A0A9D3SJS5_9TELE|nr:hypothetical protein KOW79_010078 [Hemibagrus wyckioides]
MGITEAGEALGGGQGMVGGIFVKIVSGIPCAYRKDNRHSLLPHNLSGVVPQGYWRHVGTSALVLILHPSLVGFKKPQAWSPLNL